MNVPNRLAREGEKLQIHRFPSVSLGLASPADIKNVATPSPRRTLWRRVEEFFNPPTAIFVPAVCIPPGARLELQDIPVRLQKDFGVGQVEEVTFTQLTAAANSYRDAVRFKNGRELRLQELREGQRVLVLSLESAETTIDQIRQEAAEREADRTFRSREEAGLTARGGSYPSLRR